MVVIPQAASDSQVLTIVLQWIDVLAREDYEAIFHAVGYAVAFDRPGAACIENQIKQYRSDKLYPGVTVFTVTDWRAAYGGNPSPLQLVSRYKSNSTGLAGAVDFDLPLNGRWSDLTASFVFCEPEIEGGDYVLSLEEIGAPHGAVEDEA
jgi:hypothetical protein